MMTDVFRVILLVGVLFYLLLIMILMRKGRMSLKYSLMWFGTGIVLLIVAIFPQIVSWLADLFGIYSEVNVVFFLGVCFILVIILSLTSIVSGLCDRLRSLTQTQAMLEKRVRDLEKQLENQNK